MNQPCLKCNRRYTGYDMMVRCRPSGKPVEFVRGADGCRLFEPEIELPPRPGWCDRGIKAERRKVKVGW